MQGFAAADGQISSSPPKMTFQKERSFILGDYIMVKVKEFIKNEIVLILSFVLAAISAFFVSPNKGYFEYIDFRTLGLLFCLMAVMAGLNSIGVFKFVAEKMLSKVKSISGLSLILGLQIGRAHV